MGLLDQDRMDLLRWMIPLKYGMYYKFVELLRYRSKTFPAISAVENKDKDTLDLNEEIIKRWS